MTARSFQQALGAALLCAVLGPGTNLRAAEPSSQPVATGDLLLRGGRTSVRVRLHVGTDGRNWLEHYEGTRARFVAGLFAWLDSDADGGLSEAEAKRSPPPSLLMAQQVEGGEPDEVHVAFNYRVIDDDDDGRVSPRELGDFYRAFGDQPIRIVPLSAASGQAAGDDLFRRLDADGSGDLTAEEQGRAAALFDLDRDGNGVLSAAEIVRPGVAAGGENVARAATGGAPGEVLALTWEEAADQPADLDVIVDLSAGPTGAGPWHATFPPDNPRFRGQILTDGALVVYAAGNVIELLVRPAPFRTEAQHAATLQRELASADADGDGLVPAGHPLPDMLKQHFDLLDRNGDRALDRGELDAYRQTLLPLLAEMEASRMTIVIGRRRTGLFGLLDRNDDGRLGLRELRALSRVSAECDANRDGRLSAAEVPAGYSVLIRRGALAAPYETAASSNAGPAWFSRLDRNRDGDLSAAEFPGGPDVFERLDADRDGLISLAEAVHADRKFQGNVSIQEKR